MKYKTIDISKKWFILAFSVLFLAIAGCGGGADQLLDRGLKALENDDAAKAAIILEEASAKLPDNSTVFYNLGIAYWKDNQPESAVGAFVRAAELSQTAPEPYEYLGNVYTELENWNEALQAFDHAMDRGGRTARLLTAMAVVKLHTEDLIQARMLLTEALKADSYYTPALYNMAVLYRDRAKNKREATKYFKRFIEASEDPARMGPPVSEALLTDAESYIGPTVETVVETRDKGQETSVALETRDKGQETSVAVETVEKVQETSVTLETRDKKQETSTVVTPAPVAEVPVEVEKLSGAAGLLAEADSAVEKGEYVLAKIKLSEARVLEPDNPEVLWQLALLYDRHLDFGAKAEALYREFKSKYPEDRRSKLIILPSAVKSKPAPRRKKAAAKEPVPVIKAGVAQELFDKAFEAHQGGDWDKAIDLYEQALTHDATLYNAVYNMGLLHKKKGNMQKAATLFERATELDPQHIKAWYMLGLARKELVEYKDAITAAERALTIQPDYVRAHYLLGLLYALQDRPDMAKKHFNRCINLAPGDPMAVSARAHLNDLP